MTDPFPASRRTRRRSGRHVQQPVRRTESTPLPPEQARRNRDAAFGGPNPKRTWVGGATATPSADSAPPAPSASSPPPTSSTPPASSAPSASSAPEPEAAPGTSPSRGTTSPREASPAAAAADAGPSQPLERPAPRRPRGRRAAFPLDQIPESPAAPTSPAEPGTPPRGRRAAVGTAGAASSPEAAVTSEPDAWAATRPSDDPAPLSPGAEPAPTTPHRAADTPDGPAASPAPRVVPGRRSSVAAGAATGAAGAAAADGPAAGSPSTSADGPAAESPSSAADGRPAGSASSSAEDWAQDSPAATSHGAAGAGAAAAAGGSRGASGGNASGGNTSGGAGSGGPGSGDRGDGAGHDGPSGPRDGGSTADDGSLAKVAGWTVLTSAIPGSGLVTTGLRRIGVVMIALLVLAVATVTAVLVINDPLRLAATLGTHRGVLIGALVVAVVVGLVWCLQIVLANLAQSTKQRLQGAKRYLALALAAVMVIAVAVPFGRGVQSLWALQGLFGSTTVFGGDSGELADGPDPWADTPRLNIMLLGQDAGADRTGTRPDTIMVASIDTETGQTALFSIPRNLENVEFPEGTVAAEEFPDGFDYYGRNENLINAVWAWAEENSDLFPGDPEPGLTATRWAVEETLGISTDYYAMVNLQGFEDLVDALGGVDLVVERRIPIGGGASEVEGYIEPGDQTLDGFHALWYARSREGSDDFNRMCRQQRIVRAVSEEADPTSLALSVPRLVTATEENIQTDIPVRNVDAFVELALRIKEGGFTSYPITQDVTFSGDPDWEYLEKWVDASIEDSMTATAPESVQGETEPGSTEPAETGAPPEEDTASEEEETTPTEEETTSEDEQSTEEASPSEKPEIEQDPLKSCLPGAEQ